MKRLIFGMAIIATLISISNVRAEDCESTIGSTGCIMLLTSFAPTLSISGDGTVDKEIFEAREDATAFVASEGMIRSTRLQNAILMIRAKNPNAILTDLEIAEEIAAIE